MTTFYPNQPTPSFLKRYTKNVYNRVQHDAHVNGHGHSDEASLHLQPYRSTPLILPSAKINHQRNFPTESYLRHHPNPQMRAHPGHDYTDGYMKQKVADSVLHRFVGSNDEAANGSKIVHKQFNSPIGLYSDHLIESTLKNTVSPPPSVGSSSVPYKKTVVFDPLKSETYRALQESSYEGERVQEVTAPAQTRVFQPNRMVPGKKPVSSFPPPDPISRHPTNSLGEPVDVIHQSGSFKRLMYHVLGETDY